MDTPPPAITAATPCAWLRHHHPGAWQHLLDLLPHAPPEPPPALLEPLLDQIPLDRNTLLFRLNETAGLLGGFLPRLPLAERARLTSDRHDANDLPPAALQQFLAAVPPALISTLDTAPLLQAGRDPFQAIQALAAALPAEGVLLLQVPFKPLPLFQMMAQAGFAHLNSRHGPGWVVAFHRRPAPPLAASERTNTLDVRGLAPPQPMVNILAQCALLNPGDTLTVTLDRAPQPLLPRLQERGLTWRLHEGENITLTITRPGPVNTPSGGNSPP